MLQAAHAHHCVRGLPIVSIGRRDSHKTWEEDAPVSSREVFSACGPLSAALLLATPRSEGAHELGDGTLFRAYGGVEGHKRALHICAAIQARGGARHCF